jgi:hypothetical protein
MKLPRHLTTSVFLLAAGCATTGESSPRRDPQREALYRFQAEQEVFRAQYTGTHVFDFEGHGRVTVREISLDGFPGNTYLRCRFHYQNRTDKPVMQSWVCLDVLDAKGRVTGSRACHLVMPTSTAIDRGSYFSDELRTPTGNAHLQAGWSWRIRCQSDQQQPEEPLDPPIPEPPRIDPSPIYIKDPSWFRRQRWNEYYATWAPAQVGWGAPQQGWSSYAPCRISYQPGQYGWYPVWGF